jgi:hypothetical protein
MAVREQRSPFGLEAGFEAGDLGGGGASNPGASTAAYPSIPACEYIGGDAMATRVGVLGSGDSQIPRDVAD